MPTYDYICQKCGHQIEVFHSMKDEPLKKCPACKKLGLKRLLGAGAGLIFKGSGFYITDYKKKTGQPDKPATADKKGEKKAEAKPVKADAKS